MSEYTPGPWTLEQDNGWPWKYHVIGADQKAVMAYDLWCHSTRDKKATANARPENAECHANARLIASAPDLLEALQEALIGLAAAEGNRCAEMAARKARAAIAKATGEAA